MSKVTKWFRGKIEEKQGKGKVKFETKHENRETYGKVWVAFNNEKY